jgi:2-polyprenyl-3-methyl-5-hydroxy-6-metoxy-1,4-benzoquinol methylase
MTEDILNASYWKQRLETATDRHQAIFRCDLARWRRIEEKHRQILARTIGNIDSILDAGCGWGRLLDLMPKHWYGSYIGIDISPDFIDLARNTYPRRVFRQGDLANLAPSNSLHPTVKYDWAICISMRPMIRRNLGDDYWDTIQYNLLAFTNRILFLEYDEQDEGEIYDGRN